MIQLNKKQKVIVAGITITIIVIGGIAIYFYEKGKSQTTQATIPPDTDGNGNLITTPTDTNNDTQIATQIYNDCNGIDWFADHDENIYSNALALSNTDFVAMYNIFNTLYQSKSGYTLTGIINASYAVPFSPWSASKQAMLARLGNLNLP